MLWLAGWFDTTVRELYEMRYQYEFDYIFDSTKENVPLSADSLRRKCPQNSPSYGSSPTRR